VATEIVSPTVQ